MLGNSSLLRGGGSESGSAGSPAGSPSSASSSEGGEAEGSGRAISSPQRSRCSTPGRAHAHAVHALPSALPGSVADAQPEAEASADADADAGRRAEEAAGAVVAVVAEAEEAADAETMVEAAEEDHRDGPPSSLGEAHSVQRAEVACLPTMQAQQPQCAGQLRPPLCTIELQATCRKDMQLGPCGGAGGSGRSGPSQPPQQQPRSQRHGRGGNLWRRFGPRLGLVVVAGCLATAACALAAGRGRTAATRR